MWEPPDSWRQVAGAGPASVGLWRVPGHVPTVAKRLARPEPGDAAERSAPGHQGYWRREADVALSGVVASSAGLRAPQLHGVEEDEEGITLLFRYVERVSVAPEHVAAMLGRFNASAVQEHPWVCRGQFGQRLDALERRGGWTHLERTQYADLTAALWERRWGLRALLAGVRSGPAHGDLTPGNVLGPSSVRASSNDGEALWVADWAMYGSAAWGSDLGYFSLSVPGRRLEALVEPYVQGLTGGRPASTLSLHGVDPADVLAVARAVAVTTVLTRADWAVGRAAGGEGPLAAKLSHPSVCVPLRLVAAGEPAIRELLGLA